jgi:hypothetical protein
MVVKWLDTPEDHDFDAAADYLSMLGETGVVGKTVAALRAVEPVLREAKDILRAASLPLLPQDNVHVQGDLHKITAGKKLSPILLVRGNALEAVRLEIADGYHRVCASYLTDEDTPIPCCLASWQS